jgi:hypothetical protein
VTQGREVDQRMETIKSKEYDRQILHLQNESVISIDSILESGQDDDGCFVCCSAPACLPLLGILPCFRNPEYIIAKHESSKYVYIRENSLEWNTPNIVLSGGACCGIDPCMYTVRDHVHVLYYDDPVFDHLSDQVNYLIFSPFLFYVSLCLSLLPLSLCLNPCLLCRQEHAMSFEHVYVVVAVRESKWTRDVAMI